MNLFLGVVLELFGFLSAPFYGKALYKLRHLVENAFLHLKRWRGIAARYTKNVSSFVAAVQIRCLALWLVIS